MPKRSAWLIVALIAFTVAVLAGLAIWGDVFSGPEGRRVEVSPEEVASVHQRLLTVDTHVDISPDWASEKLDALSDPRGEVDLTRMRAGGLDAAFFVVYVPQGSRTVAGTTHAVSQAFAKFSAIRRMTDERNSDVIELARSADDIERINKAGKLVALIGIENGHALGGRLELLKIYYDLGARYLGLAYNGENDLADGALALGPGAGAQTPEHQGLSELGRAVIAECNRLGLMIDVAHASKDVVLQAAQLSKAPIIDSHTGVAAIDESPRNLDDEALKAIAESGGVAQIFAWDSYVRPVPKEKQEALAALREEFKLGPGRFPSDLAEEEWGPYRAKLAAIDERWPRADIAAFADHIDHAVKVIGVDHVGIASDFGGGQGIKGWMDMGETPNVTAELLARGYSEKDLAKIWSGNVLRVMRKVAEIAEKEQMAER